MTAKWLGMFPDWQSRPSLLLYDLPRRETCAPWLFRVFAILGVIAWGTHAWKTWRPIP